MENDNVQFFINKIKEIVKEELIMACKESRLNIFNEDDIPNIILIVEKYCKDMPLAIMYGTVNDLLERVLKDCYIAKEKIKSSLKKYDCEIRFSESVKTIDLSFNQELIEKLSNNEKLKIINEPMYRMEMIGTRTPFVVEKEDENSVTIRTQYFDNNGDLLPEPWVVYIVGNDVMNEYPTHLIGTLPLRAHAINTRNRRSNG